MEHEVSSFKQFAISGRDQQNPHNNAMTNEEVWAEIRHQLTAFLENVRELKRFEKLRKLRFAAPFACKEVFQALGSLIKALPLLEELTVSFIEVDKWKDWVFADTEMIEIEELSMPVLKESVEMFREKLFLAQAGQ